MQGGMTPIKMSPGCSLGRSGGRTLGVALGVARTTSGSLMDVVRSAISVRPSLHTRSEVAASGLVPRRHASNCFSLEEEGEGLLKTFPHAH
jgi:hypothetical protein